MDIAERFQKIRKQKDITIRKLSRVTGITESRIRSFEKGKTQQTIHFLEQLLEPMEITLYDFFNNNLDDYYLTQYDKELLKHIHFLTKTQADIILELVQNMNK